MADLPGNFEKAMEVYLWYLPYPFSEGYLGSSDNCHLSIFRTYLISISSSSDTSHGTIRNSRYAAVNSQYVKVNMTVPRKVKVHTNGYLQVPLGIDTLFFSG